MVKPYSVLFLLFFPALFAAGQNAPLPEDSLAYAAAPLYDYYPPDERRGDMPVKVDYTVLCPRPSDQGTSSRCVGDALAHALTVSISKKCSKHSPAEHARSASFIFNQVKLDEKGEKGAYLSHGLKLLKDKGDCSAAAFPNTLACEPMPDARTLIAAFPYRINSFQALFPHNAPSKQKLDQIKTSLANGHPVIVAMYIPADMRNREVPLTGDAWSPATPKSGHAMVVVGYDEREKDNCTFTLMNSYGEQWGDGGFFTVSYDAMVEHVGYAYHFELRSGFQCP